MAGITWSKIARGQNEAKSLILLRRTTKQWLDLVTKMRKTMMKFSLMPTIQENHFYSRCSVLLHTRTSRHTWLLDLTGPSIDWDSSKQEASVIFSSLFLQSSNTLLCKLVLILAGRLRILSWIHTNNDPCCVLVKESPSMFAWSQNATLTSPLLILAIMSKYLTFRWSICLLLDVLQFLANWKVLLLSWCKVLDNTYKQQLNYYLHE